MKKLCTFFVIVTALAACSKDKFETVPTVRIVSFGPSEITVGNHFSLVASVTDKEGDVQDSIILVHKRFLASDVQVDSSQKYRYSIKDFGVPTRDKIELNFNFVYGRIEDDMITQDLESDFDRELALGIIVIDNAGHRSEYVESNKILLKKFP